VTAYAPLDIFTTPELYDLSDLVQGGATGDANTPLKALADQTNYLRNRLRRWEGIKVITGNYTLDPVGDLGQFTVAQVAANTTLVLPDAGNLAVGTRIPIATSITGVKALTVLSQHGQPIVDGITSWLTWDTSQPGMYMHDAEKLVLVAAGDHFIVERADGNFYTYGDSYGARIQRGNTLVMDGSLINRADVPRIALIVVAGGPAVVDDGSWLSDPGGKPVWRGLFSTGNGTTNLRIPDERGMMDKYMDLGRGRDLFRFSSRVGSFEDEMVGKHDHATHGKGPILGAGFQWFLSVLFGNRYAAGGGSDGFGGKQGSPDLSMRTSDNDGTKNIVENIGKLPLLKY